MDILQNIDSYNKGVMNQAIVGIAGVARCKLILEYYETLLEEIKELDGKNNDQEIPG